jgi:hypothetical protein
VAAAQDAINLYLAGASLDRIAAATRLGAADVYTLIAEELERRHPNHPAEVAAELERIDALWTRVYSAGVAGDVAAAAVAMRLSQHRMTLLSRAAEVPESESPAHSIRDSWSSLALGAEEAAETLRQLARSGSSESVRLGAARSLLSRVGITERVEVAAQVRMASATMDPDDPTAVGKTSAEIVRERLDVLSDRLRRVQVIDAVE